MGSGPGGVAVADLNGDGKADLVTTNYLDGTISVLLSDGDGTFRPAVNYAIAGAGPNAVTIADFNGVREARSRGRQRLQERDLGPLGQWRWHLPVSVNYATSDFTKDLVVADFNGDGNLDIAATDESGGVSVLLVNGNGTFQTELRSSITINAGALAVSDFNPDGKPDLVVVNSDRFQNLTIFLGNGDGTFTQGATYTPSPESLPGEIFAVAVTDLNRDGKPTSC